MRLLGESVGVLCSFPCYRAALGFYVVFRRFFVSTTVLTVTTSALSIMLFSFITLGLVYITFTDPRLPL